MEYFDYRSYFNMALHRISDVRNPHSELPEYYENGFHLVKEHFIFDFSSIEGDKYVKPSGIHERC